MRRKLVFLLMPWLFFILFPPTADASLLSVDQEGKIVWQVLSYEDDYSLDIPRHSSLEVTNVGDEEGVESSVNLLKEGDKMSLLVYSGNETRELDVSGMNGDLVTIEERPDVQKISIGVENDKFSLQQKGIKALTDFPIKVDPETAELTLKTQSGERFLSILPIQAVETLLRSNLLTNIKDNTIKITEEDSELQYLVEGEKKLDVLDVFDYTIPVKSKVSASTGEILKIEAPVWYKVVALLVT